MPSTKPFITLNDVSIRLRDQIFFDGLTWEMLSDQHWAVIGPNGSGKSTLMKALCGSLPVVKGKIVYHFLRDNGHTAVHDHIAYVTFESQRKVLSDEAFYQERWNIGVTEGTPSVSDFLSEPDLKRINPYHVVETRSDKNLARRQDVIERLELGALLHRSVVQLSNGERRKVTIARALLKHPKLLILDNPFAGLDERFRVKLAEHLENLMQDEMRVIVVGTNRDEIPRGVTHVLSVEAGRAIAQEALQAASSFRAERETPDLHKRFLVAKSAPRNDNDAGRALICMNNVTVSYNGTPVLRQVNWTVRENERWALLGPNGAGKTTLLSLILADHPQAYANDITLFGKRRGTGESIWEIKRNIGWVAPELQLYYPRGATCLDVVCSGWFDSVGLYRECSPPQREVALLWLHRFDLATRAETAFDQVSEGEQRLALLARALVKSPALLVLDEPCQGLDADHRDRVLQAVEQVSRRPNSSLIYVTHRADELPHSITHVFRLNEGRVVSQTNEEGSTKSTKDRKENFS
jgi:molybdate transport system ATP-binding protein